MRPTTRLDSVPSESDVQGAEPRAACHNQPQQIGEKHSDGFQNGGGIKLKCRRRKTKREQHRTHRQKIGKPAVSADSCRKENTDGDLWFTRKSHEQNEFLSCQLLARRQQMRREESNIRRNWPKYRRITNKQETGKTRWRRQKNKVVATAQGNSIGQANLDQLARETSTSNLLPAVVPGGAEMGLGLED
jgi:hypothetical protein